MYITLVQSARLCYGLCGIRPIRFEDSIRKRIGRPIRFEIRTKKTIRRSLVTWNILKALLCSSQIILTASDIVGPLLRKLPVNGIHAQERPTSKAYNI